MKNRFSISHEIKTYSYMIFDNLKFEKVVELTDISEICEICEKLNNFKSDLFINNYINNVLLKRNDLV